MDGWQNSLKLTDYVDVCVDGRWIVAEVIDVSSLHLMIAFKHLEEVCEEKIEKDSPRLAPSKSKTSLSVSVLIQIPRKRESETHCAQRLTIFLHEGTGRLDG